MIWRHRYNSMPFDTIQQHWTWFNGILYENKAFYLDFEFSVFVLVKWIPKVDRKRMHASKKCRWYFLWKHDWMKWLMSAWSWSLYKLLKYLLYHLENVDFFHRWIEDKASTPRCMNEMSFLSSGSRTDTTYTFQRVSWQDSFIKPLQVNSRMKVPWAPSQCYP